jgi:phosphoenolpyruvate carboxykinase (ATP)
MQVQRNIESYVEGLLQTVTDTVNRLSYAENVACPNTVEIKQAAERYGVRTAYGNFNFVSAVRNRSACLTVYIGSQNVLQRRLDQKQKEILKHVPQTLELVREYVKATPLVCVRRMMGDNRYFSPQCTLYVSVQRKEMIRLAYMVGQALFPLRKGAGGPSLCLLCLPEWQEKDRQVLVFPEIGVTYVLGSDYYGEVKKAFLRMGMWLAKQKGMLGVHAGAKIVKTRDKTGTIRKYSMILFGLSATGKTTHACHNHGLLKEGEGQEIVQDDVVFLRQDGSALGPERGFYFKTNHLDPKVQPMIFRTAISRNTILENVMLDYLGNIYFDEAALTENGRGIVQRDDLGADKSESANLPSLNELDGMIIFFITRQNTVVPIASRLTPEQAAAAFMLGESVETSAGDPRRAGESVREVGTNPFIIGDKAYEGNWFYHFVKKHSSKVRCYLLNTGGVGEVVEDGEGGSKIVRQAVLRVEIPEMAAIIKGIVRETVEWSQDPYFNTLVPRNVDEVQMAKFDLSRFYSQEQINAYINKLKKERIEWLQKFDNLNPAILNTLKH